MLTSGTSVGVPLGSERSGTENGKFLPGKLRLDEEVEVFSVVVVESDEELELEEVAEAEAK